MSYEKNVFVSEIKDKVIIITGANSEIGEATALLLAERGAKIVLGAHRVERLEALAESIVNRGGEAIYASTDVQRSEDLSSLVRLATERYGKLDVFINNTGIMPISPLDELRIEDWNVMIDINMKGVLYGIAAALPVFRKQGFGHIVNTSSTAGHKTGQNQSVYSGTKFTVRAISEGLRQEAGDQLRVSVISPGIVRTNFTESITNKEMRDRLANIRDELAMPPDAVARAIAFVIEQPADIAVNEIVIRPTAQV
ncbi:SDR family oxidoreductase [Paenibacillus sp. MMO-177]|uniref:SDR family oxidoreductase n=1 Tax=Paenibacillus sp. MMO-177 TaxID=3081289 RepID=UPI0030172968